MPRETTLLRSQANAVLEQLEASGLDPSAFELRSVQSQMTDDLLVSQLHHKPSGHFFTFEIHKERQFTIRSPGRDIALDRQYPGSWSGQWDYFCEWCEVLRLELSEPDLWAAYTDPSVLAQLASSSDVGNEPFADDEIARISHHLDEVEGRLREMTAVGDLQAEFIRAEFDYLRGALARQGRRDWLHTAIGVVVTVAVAIGLAPDEARALFQAVGRGMQTLLA